MSPDNTSINMTRTNKHILLQYKMLRDEILDNKNRISRILIIGITGIPIVIGAGEKFDLCAVLATCPLIVLVFALLLVFEQNSLMRAGEYIRDIIEPELHDRPIMFWEEWLEDRRRRRTPEMIQAIAVFITFALYFIIGTCLAFKACTVLFGLMWAFFGLGIYVMLFLVSMIAIIKYFALNTYFRNLLQAIRGT